MSVIIPIELRRERDHRNIHDDMDSQLDDIYAVASLFAVVDSDEVFDGQINATGYLLTRMIKEAKNISKEHYTLWREELEERIEESQKS